MAREDIYTMARALSRDLSRARRRAQRDCPILPQVAPPTNILYCHIAFSNSFKIQTQVLVNISVNRTVCVLNIILLSDGKLRCLDILLSLYFQQSSLIGVDPGVIFVSY